MWAMVVATSSSDEKLELAIAIERRDCTLAEWDGRNRIRPLRLRL
jgi:hypothetical protein